MVLLEDLENGDLSLDAKEVSAKQAWERYSTHPAFKGIVCKEQFSKQVAAHRDQVRKKLGPRSVELAALEHDRKLHPMVTTNNRGEPMFNRSPAKELLRRDVEEKKHVGLTPSEFQQTRTEYHPFDGKVFKHRIYQEVRRVKFLFWLNMKREAKMKEAQVQKEKAVLSREELRAKQEKTRMKLEEEALRIAEKEAQEELAAMGNGQRQRAKHTE